MKGSGLDFIKPLAIIATGGILVTLAACTSAPASTPAPESVKSVTVNLSVENEAFDKNTITAPAGAEVIVIFNNKDSGVHHNLTVALTQAVRKSIYNGNIITGPMTINCQFLAPSTPGTYFFRCDVHPSSETGDFIVTDTGS
jgi:plastocyanin